MSALVHQTWTPWSLLHHCTHVLFAGVSSVVHAQEYHKPYPQLTKM